MSPPLAPTPKNHAKKKGVRVPPRRRTVHISEPQFYSKDGNAFGDIFS